MSVTIHETGGYRAYKKINGKEYQFYSHDIKECDVKQIEFDLLAFKFKKSKLFNKKGTLTGFTICAVLRKGRAPSIVAKKQITGKNGIEREELKVTNVTDAIAWMLAIFVDFHHLKSEQLIKLSSEIKLAKSIYLVDINKAKLKIEQSIL